jgi:hypothetical protein
MTAAASKRLVARIQEEFGYCTNCQPFEAGEPVWILGERNPLFEVFQDYEIPEEQWRDVAAALRCPNCGADLDALDDVGLLSEHDRAVRELWSEWRKRWARQFEEFHEHLERLPYLGLAHRMGRRISKAVRALPTSEIQEETWFRARAILDSTVPRSSDFWPPDPARVQVPEGRYNHYGQSIFYLADSAEAAGLEALGVHAGVVWVQQFTIRSLLPVLDLAPEILDDPDPRQGLVALGLAHTGVLRRAANRYRSWKPEHFLPRFVADCARSCGIKAIVFASHHCLGRCLATFEWDSDTFRVKGKPRLRKLEFRRGGHGNERSSTA